MCFLEQRAGVGDRNVRLNAGSDHSFRQHLLCRPRPFPLWRHRRTHQSRASPRSCPMLFDAGNRRSCRPAHRGDNGSGAGPSVGACNCGLRRRVADDHKAGPVPFRLAADVAKDIGNALARASRQSIPAPAPPAGFCRLNGKRRNSSAIAANVDLHLFIHQCHHDALQQRNGHEINRTIPFNTS